MEIKRAQELGLSDYPVFTRKENTDVSFLACARLLLQAQDVVFPQFATHNAASAAAIMQMAGTRRNFEFQRLHGMGEELHNALMKNYGLKSRIYAPVGDYKDLLPYLVRRLLENGANSSFVNQFLDPDVSADDLARDPISLAAQNKCAVNPQITYPPRALFKSGRLAARGIDLSQSISAVQIKDWLSGAAKITAKSIINGNEVCGSGYDVTNPAKAEEIVGTAENIDAKQLAAAFKAARSARWGEAAPLTRSAALLKAATLLEADMEDFMALCVTEAGKSWIDAEAEVREAVDFCRYYAEQISSPDMANREALGTVACISPWNFPLAIFIGQVSASLAAGNAVICKPAEQTPLIAYKAVKLLHRAGVPKEALHLVLGSGPEVGAALAGSEEIDGICFTGSMAIAQRIHQGLAKHRRASIPLIAETGGINAMIVDSTALIEQAVSDLIASAFQSAGQRCSACRFVCVQEEIADSFIAMLSGAMNMLKIGNPASLSTDIGPVIDSEALLKLSRYIDNAPESWRLIGRTPQDISKLDGHFLSPAAFEIPSISELTEEQFGPVLHLMRFKAGEFNALIEEINALGYGLTLGLHSRLDSRAESVSKRAKVGNIYINRNQIGAVVGVQPFGGEGLSGTGPKAGGPRYLRRLSRPLAVDKLALESHAFCDGAKSRPEATLIKSSVEASRAAFKLWTHIKNRKACLIRAANTCEGGNKDQILAMINAAQSALHPVNLPGPTGEINRLEFHGRGVLACLGAHQVSGAVSQIFKIVAAGNGAILTATDGIADHLRSTVELIEVTGAPRGLVQVLPAAFAAELLKQADIQGAVVDGASRAQAAELLSERKGAILPVLSIDDEAERFIVERTISIDATAAGGNASLLAL
jgi:RHH-type proline utilization regulon transcriptional repressor/proline dehydrogenase/delta 1-pyrroline-5-carboxylate dehydrogenase